MRSNHTTTEEVVDGIGLIVENGIEIKERDIGFSLLRSKDEAYALGK